MEIQISVKKSHLYGFLSCLIVILGAFMVSAFGGSNPSVLGHSAAELIVNGTSVVDNSLTGADIDESTLGTVPSATSASSASTASTASVVSSSPGCGGNNFFHPDPGSCIATLSSNNFATYTAPSGHSFTGSGVTVSGGALDVTHANGLRTGSTQRLDTSGNLVNIGSITASGSISATSGTISTGGNVVSRSTGCPSFNYLTTDGVAAVGCAGLTDTGLRVD